MSQKLFIPRIGTLLILDEPWSFNLYFERRNKSMLEAFGPTKTPKVPVDYNSQTYYDFDSYSSGGFRPENFKNCDVEVGCDKAMTEEELDKAFNSYRGTSRKDQYYLKVTLPKDTMLKVDRVYVRNGVEAYDSITFRTQKDCPDQRFKSCRFWVKLNDANKIVCNVI